MSLLVHCLHQVQMCMMTMLHYSCTLTVSAFRFRVFSRCYLCDPTKHLYRKRTLVRNSRVQISALHGRFVEVHLLQSNQTHCIPRISFNFNHPASDWAIQRRLFRPLDLRIDLLHIIVRSRHDSLAIFSTKHDTAKCSISLPIIVVLPVHRKRALVI